MSLLINIITYCFFFLGCGIPILSHNVRNSMEKNSLTLESVRHSLIRQEDSIIFSLIERAHFPINSPTYSQSYVSNSIPAFSGSLLRFVAKETEAPLAKVCMCFSFKNIHILINKILILSF